MKKWRTIALGSAGAAVIAALAAAFAIHILVAPERLKHEAREKAATWSRDLAIGEVSLHWWPFPALHAGKVALSNPPWAKTPHLVQAESVSARLELLPLLAGKVRFKSLHLEGAKLNLEVAADGAKSWEPAAGAKGGAAKDAGVLNLIELEIRDADITYRPQGAPASQWHVEEAVAEAEPGLRDVHIDAHVSRNRRPVHAIAQFDDLSRIGEARAVSAGKVELDWGKTQLALAGRFAVSARGEGQAIAVDLKSASLSDMLAFFGIERRPTRALVARFDARESQGRIEVTQLAASLGKLKVTGNGELTMGPKPVFRANLETDRLDWVQALLDAGEPALPPLPPEEMFHESPIAWPLLAALRGTEGSAEVKIRSLRLRNGVELTNARARMAFNGERLDMNPFTAELLGGSASGSMQFDARTKNVRVNVEGSNLLLERWFRERGSEIPFKGGPMKVNASLQGSGASMKELAATSTGPVIIRMGPGVWASAKAGHAEEVMVHSFSGKGASAIEFECAVAVLPFVAGRATARPIVGLRSTASSLITSGFIDLREETLDLRGPVKGRSGSVGLASIAEDMKITGLIRRPKASIDAASTPKAVARAGAAILTAGATLVGKAFADAAKANSTDACQAVLAGAKAAQAS
jgi:uncharacterized protein involved in outer membrane biogenesis